jgi:hypothetical protein
MNMTRAQFNQIIVTSDAIFANIFGVLNDENLNHLYENFLSKKTLFENYFLRQKEIKFLAIAEASTDINSTYFYSNTALNYTPWFNVPLQNFSPENQFLTVRTAQNKITALNNLSTEGFLLIDISPAAFVLNGINRNQLNFKKLINFLLEKYFFEFVIPTISSKISKNTKYILMGTKVTDRIVYDFVLNQSDTLIHLKEAGVCEGFERHTMSSACATNSPILRLFNCAIQD